MASKKNSEKLINKLKEQYNTWIMYVVILFCALFIFVTLSYLTAKRNEQKGNEMLEKVIKENEELIKHDTLALKVIYGEEKKDYTKTNINGEELNIDVEVVK